MKKLIASVLALLMLCPFSFPLHGEGEEKFPCKSALLMEVSTGKILYEQNSEEALPPASVTKIMTLLLVMEAIENGKMRLTDQVQTSETAASMGGSQIYLEVGEEMSVDDLIKSVTVASANDAAAALAEYHSGSLENFVSRMNERAKELKMTSTHFENVNGLDDTTNTHLTSAKDIALMSRALLQYDLITKYSTIWMDTVRNGTFGLTNTNRLIRFYKGATGLKTGFTSKAGFCISASAKRNGLHLVAVVMGAETRDSRNQIATKLLDYGFANYELYKHEEIPEKSLEVKGSNTPYCTIKTEPFQAIVEKGKGKNVEIRYTLPPYLSAPLKKKEIISEIDFLLDGKSLGKSVIYFENDVEKMTFADIFRKMLDYFSLF